MHAVRLATHELPNGMMPALVGKGLRRLGFKGMKRLVAKYRWMGKLLGGEPECAIVEALRGVFGKEELDVEVLWGKICFLG
jgi:hypothetical protein